MQNEMQPKEIISSSWVGPREVGLTAFAFVSLSVVLAGVMSAWHPWHTLLLSPDSAFTIWSLKWWPHSLLLSKNPFNAPFFAPYGQNLAWTTSTPTLALLAAPITFLFGPVIAYNVINILALAANGVLTHLTARQINCRLLPAFACAVVFYFSSYTWGQLLGHINLTVTAFALAAIYVTVRRIYKGIGRAKYVCIASVLLALQFGVSNEIYATLIFFSGIAFAIFALLEMNSVAKLELARLACDMALGVIISLGLTSPYLYEIFTHSTSNLQPISSYVSDPINYLIPTQTNWLLGNTFKRVSERFVGNASEQSAYLGLPIVVLLVVAGRDFYRSPINKLLLATFITVVICSFGPHLSILGIATIWMPWSLVEKLPLIKEALPIRFGLYTSFLASLLVGRLLTETYTAKVKVLVLASIVALIPNLSLYKMSAVENNKFLSTGKFRQIIPHRAKVLVLPTYGFGGSQPALWQAQSDFWFSVVDGLAGKVPSVLERYEWYYYGGAEPRTARIELLQFINDTRTQFVLADARAHDRLSTIFRGLDLAHIQYGHVSVTKISPAVIAGLLHSERERRVRHICTSLARLVNYGFDYTERDNHTSLTPTAVDNANFDGAFGKPMDPGSTAANWTTDGYWLGNWDSGVGVGFSPIGSIAARRLYDVFKRYSRHVYFPYPRQFHGVASPSASGQFLVLLESRPDQPISCK